MKKLFSALIILASVLVMSSCVIVASDSTPDPTYTLYFFNDSENTHIYDWYLKDDGGHNYEKSKDYVPVKPGEISSISDLHKDYYQVWFCVYSSPNRDTDVYTHTKNFVYLNSDTTFRLASESYRDGRPRSVSSSIEQSEELKYVLIDSNGNKYPLVQDQ